MCERPAVRCLGGLKKNIIIINDKALEKNDYTHNKVKYLLVVLSSL